MGDNIITVSGNMLQIDGVNLAITSDVGIEQTFVVSRAWPHIVIDGDNNPTLKVKPNLTYKFDLSNGTNGAAHGTNGFHLYDSLGGSFFTAGVSMVGTQGTAGAYIL